MFQETLLEPICLWIRNPDGLLWFVDLCLVLSFHLDGREKKLCGVGIDRPLDQLDMAGHVEARSPAGVPAILKAIIGTIHTYVS